MIITHNLYNFSIFLAHLQVLCSFAFDFDLQLYKLINV